MLSDKQLEEIKAKAEEFMAHLRGSVFADQSAMIESSFAVTAGALVDEVRRLASQLAYHHRVDGSDHGTCPYCKEHDALETIVAPLTPTADPNP